MQLGRMIDFRTFVLHCKTFLERREQLLGRQAVQIFYEAIVIDDLQLTVRKNNGQKKTILLCLRYAPDWSSSSPPDPRGGGRTVMPVGHVQRRNLFENLGNPSLHGPDSSITQN